MSYKNTNIFARILCGELPAHKVWEDDMTLAFLDIMPRAHGHTLVIPKAHCENLLDCPENALQPLIATTQKVASALKEVFKADGILLQQLSGEAAGQEVFHLHIHLIPRHHEQPLFERKMADQSRLAEQAKTIREHLKEKF